MKEVAVGIVIRNGHVLACQRRQNAKYPLKWEFPGGKLESGEAATDALTRELLEELSIKVTGVEKFFEQEWVYRDGAVDPERDGSFRVFYFLVKGFAGEPVNHVFEQIQWKRPHELQVMDILEGNREAVDRLVKYAEEQQTA